MCKEKFVWEDIVNDPVRQEAADKRAVEEDKRRADKEERLCQIHERNAERRRNRVEIQACRYATGALATGVVTFLIGDGSIGWLAWILGIVAAGLALISCFGFGRFYEMNQGNRRAALGCSRTERRQ